MRLKNRKKFETASLNPTFADSYKKVFCIELRVTSNISFRTHLITNQFSLSQGLALMILFLYFEFWTNFFLMWLEVSAHNSTIQHAKHDTNFMI